mmetsp:Transcript_35885/g.107157  ORF Transcript_35885/g.107157 Transcript_35885/m.107157 type:complete len:217 (-) Transcript_35885:2799-3449(-)
MKYLVLAIFHVIVVSIQTSPTSSFGRLSLSIRSASPYAGGCRVTALGAVHIRTGESNNASDTKKEAVRNTENKLLAEFAIASGEVINPYQVLKVPRTAERTQIRNAYRALSRKYHPDGFLQRKNSGILPGSCNSLEDVREEWERIKLSYEILSSKQMRVRYDRNSAIADPGAAMGRAAGQAALWGIAGIGKGILKAGSAVGDIAFGNNAGSEKTDS